MLAIPVRTCENIFYVFWRVFKEIPLFINLIQEQPQNDLLFADINPGVDPLAAHIGFTIDEHVFSPAIPAADLTAKIITEACHLVVKGRDKFPVVFIDKNKSWVSQKGGHHDQY